MKIMDSFCDFSGHRVNGLKTNTFFASRVKEELGDRISTMLGFQMLQNFGTYLGVPLFHRRVTNSTLRFVVEKVRSKLHSWEARQLPLVGRVTLA